MPVLCPHCGIRLTQREIDADACDICGKSPHSRPSAPARSAPVNEVSSARVLARGGQVLGWGTVRAALALALCGVILGGLGLVLMRVLATTATAERTSVAVRLLELLAIAMLLVGAAQLLSGLVMTNAVPEESGARGWSIGATVGLALMLGLFVLIFIATQQNRDARFAAPPGFGRNNLDARTELPWSPSALKFMNYGTLVLAIFASFCWGMSLRKIASSLHNRGLAAGTLVYVIVSLLVSTALAALSILLGEGKLTLTKNETELLEIGQIVVGAVMLVWFSVILGFTRGTVTRSMVS